jgi:hypothetical protein
MLRCRPMFLIVLAGVFCATALAQAPVPPVRGGRPLPRRSKQEPCWQVAGISRSAMQEARSIREQARHEIEAVCANASLSLQQKHQQIREIRQKQKQQVEGLIPPAQEQSLRACQQERSTRGHVHAGGGGGHGTGPCGEMPSGKKPQPELDQED